MKKILFILLISILVLTSCSTDRTDINKFGSKFIDDIITNPIEAEKYYRLNGDSLSYYPKETLIEISENLKGTNYTIIKQDTTYQGIGAKSYFNASIKKDDEYFDIWFLYERDSVNNIRLTDQISFINMSEVCERETNSPWCPIYDISFKRIFWTIDFNATTFKSMNIEIQNNTDIDINYIKFRVTLKNKKNSNTGDIFFNQTIESYSTIYKGDMVNINISGMQDYFIGFKFDKNKFSWEGDLIEVRPRPEGAFCKDIDELKKINLK